MRQAVSDRGDCVCHAIRPVHRLEPEVIKPEGEQLGRVKAGLRIHELQLMTVPNAQRRARLRADTKPVDSINGLLCSVCLDGDFKPELMDRVNERSVKLQQRLSAGEDDEPPWPCGRPGLRDGQRERLRRFKAAAACSIGANEIRIAKTADGAGAILLPTGPEIAAAEPTEHRGASCLSTFALQRFENLLDQEDHGSASYCPSFVNPGLICEGLGSCSKSKNRIATAQKATVRIAGVQVPLRAKPRSESAT